MKKRYLLFFCLLFAINLSAQSRKKKSPAAYNKQNKANEEFLEKQWWLGIKGGANLSKVNVESSYAIFSPVDDVAPSPKKYDKFKQMGSQVALEVTFYFKSFSLSFQPAYQHIRFAYTKTYLWGVEEDPTQRLEMKYVNEQKVDHVLFPIILKYEITGNKIRPYVQAGIYQAVLVNASKSIAITGTDYASGGINEFEKEPIVVGAKELFARYHWGLLGGAGVYYNLGNVRLNLDVQYTYGMSNIVSTSNRYNNDMLVGAGDVLDDMKLDNVAVSLGCLFPMRFLESGFKSLDRR